MLFEMPVAVYTQKVGLKLGAATLLAAHVRRIVGIMGVPTAALCPPRVYVKPLSPRQPPVADLFWALGDKIEV